MATLFMSMILNAKPSSIARSILSRYPDSLISSSQPPPHTGVCGHIVVRIVIVLQHICKLTRSHCAPNLARTCQHRQLYPMLKRETVYLRSGATHVLDSRPFKAARPTTHDTLISSTAPYDSSALLLQEPRGQVSNCTTSRYRRSPSKAVRVRFAIFLTGDS
ncbi:hypothetical protein BC628DRAFT_1392852 [Trametes gibbosa]|nr:hypothetical protein BC628DRAFT_1392852 [Trametes gibbosa]